MAQARSREAPRDGSAHYPPEKHAETPEGQHALSLHQAGGLRPHTTSPLAAEKTFDAHWEFISRTGESIVISRVENGHTVPAIETIEKLARALEVPLDQLFYDGEEPPKLPNLPKRKTSDDIAWGSSGKDARFLNQLRLQLSRMDKDDRLLLLFMAQKMARHGASQANGRN